MDVFNLLSYINKVSLFAFFITTAVVAYQIYILKKEKTKEQTPSIPDFKEKNNFNGDTNFTSLPSSLTKKELKAVSYSKMIFLIISLLTIIIVIFVISLINKNNLTQNQALVTPTITVTKVPTIVKSKVELSPTADITPTVAPTLIPDLTLTPTGITPTDLITPTDVVPTVDPELTIVPTEIVLAQAPSLTPEADLTNNQEVTITTPQTLPETGSIGKGLLIIVVAISTIFFSFWF